MYSVIRSKFLILVVLYVCTNTVVLLCEIVFMSNYSSGMIQTQITLIHSALEFKNTLVKIISIECIVNIYKNFEWVFEQNFPIILFINITYIVK